MKGLTKMTNERLKDLFNEIGLNVINIDNKLKGKTWYTFYSWINKSGKVTIKTRGIQKSFNIINSDELKKELTRFEII